GSRAAPSACHGSTHVARAPRASCAAALGELRMSNAERVGIPGRVMAPDTLIEALEAACRQWPDRRALTFGRRSLTYAELRSAVIALARAYRQLGIERGDRVVCSVSNRPEYIVALGAAWACGALHVGADYQLTASELGYVVDVTQAKALIYEP